MVEDAQALLDLRFFRFAANRINDAELIISRSGYTGELGYELYVPGEEAASLWEFLERRGKEFGLLPYGVGAMQSLRIEKALPLAGPDIDGSQTPFELGLHKWIDFSKREFVGREALLEVQERGLRQRWVGLVLDSTAPANPGDAVYTVADVAANRPDTGMDIDANEEFDAERAGWTQVGRITSSARGHSVGKMLATGLPGRLPYLARRTRDGGDRRRAAHILRLWPARRSSIPPGCACAARPSTRPRTAPLRAAVRPPAPRPASRGPSDEPLLAPLQHDRDRRGRHGQRHLL